MGGLYTVSLYVGLFVGTGVGFGVGLGVGMLQKRIIGLVKKGKEKSK